MSALNIFQILQQYETEFPMVTMCNLNPIKESSLTMDAGLQSLLGEDTAKVKKRRKRAEGKWSL